MSQKQSAVLMYEAGASIGWVAQVFGISRQGMWDILRRRTRMRDRIEALPRKPQTGDELREGVR